MTISLQDNLQKISERIQEHIEQDLLKKNPNSKLLQSGASVDRAVKKRFKRNPGWFHIRDMIQATLHVNSIEEIWGAYEWFANSDYFRVLAINDSLDSHIKSLVVTFDFEEKVIGELEIIYEKIPP